MVLLMIRSIAIAILLIAAIGPVFGASYTITEFGDDYLANGNCTLREAIQAANTNVAVDQCPAGSANQIDTINLLAGTYSIAQSDTPDDDSAITGDLDIRESLQIIGLSPQYSVIDGGAALPAAERVFDIQANAAPTLVTLRGLAIVGGRATGSGGGNVRVTNAIVEAIDVEMGSGMADFGGGISLEAGAQLTLDRSTVHGNQATSGGGLWVHPQAELSLFRSQVSDNIASEFGGGVAAFGKVTINTAVIAGNLAQQDGGGLYASGNADCTIQFSSFDRNQAARGGGLFTFPQRCAIAQSAFLSNTAATDGGGAYIGSNDTEVRRTTFANNQAARGGGVYANSTMTIFDHVTVANNQGGGMFNQSGANAEGVLLSNNLGGNCQGQAVLFAAYNLEDANSCGLVDTQDQPNFPNTDPLLGPLSDNGGPTLTLALQSGSPAIDAVDTRVQMGCQNAPDQRGYPRGRPRIFDASNNVYFCDIGAYEVVLPHRVNTGDDEVDADLNDDICLTSSGICTLRAAIQQANATPGLEEIVLPAGKITLGLNGDDNSAAAGDLDLSDLTVIRGAGRSQTIVDGNGIDRVFDIFPVSTAEVGLGDLIFSGLAIGGGRLQSGNGGGLRTSISLRLERVRVAGNSAVSGGGIQCRDDCWLEVVDSEIDSNRTNGFATFTGNGGGFIQSGSGRMSVQSSLVSNNQAGLGGGGEAIRLSVRNSAIGVNEAGTTGAIFSSSAIIEDSTITLNEADAEAGGLFLIGPSVLRNSIVARNTIAGQSKNCTFSPDHTESFGYNLSDTGLDDCDLDAATDLINSDPLFVPSSIFLLADSPAVDSGDDANCPATDLFGVARPQDGNDDQISRCDRGAVERTDILFSDGFE